MNFADFIKSVDSWKQLTLKLDKADNKTKGDVFELTTQYYLLSDPKYATKLKHVWLFREVPSAVVKRLHLPATDQGIDLIAETIEGEYWSIQCKYASDENQKISHRKISTFMSLSFGLAENITYGLVATTVDDYAALYRGKPNIGFVLSDEWNKLDKTFFDYVRARLVSKKPAKLLPLKPRPHQQQAIRNAVTHFVTQKNSRGKLIFPCGAGKSLAGYWIANTLKVKSVVVAVPSLALVKQTLEVYLREAAANKENMRWLCVCSDEGIGKNDDIAIHTQDIGIPCVTDIKQITEWLKKNKSHKAVVFTTYQSGRTLGQAAQKAKATFDLAILDEAHKTVGANDKLFSHLLYDKNIQIKRRIFMTATERFYRGSSNDIASMEDVNLFGETFDHMSFAHAVDTSILSDYKIITLAVSNQDIVDAVKDNALLKAGVEARSYAALIALRKAMKKYPIRHAVSFHGSIAKAEAFKSDQDTFTQQNPAFSPIDTFFVSGKMPTAARSKIIADFAKAPKSLITNAKCLTEGVDVPGIDAVLFADPRRSTVDIVQAVGRALRKSPGKKFGYVILPLFTGDATGDEILESDEFKEIINTLRALASNDERIVEYFRDVSKGKKPRGRLIDFDIDVNAPLKIDEQQFIRELEVRTWNRLAKLNWRPFEEARDFVRSLKLKNEAEWRGYSKSSKKPPDIPATPSKLYKKSGWTSMGEWLGTGTIAVRYREYKKFADAKKFVHALKLKNASEWFNYSRSPKRPLDIPSAPHQIYQSEWLSWGDWLGTGTLATATRTYRPFAAARNFARTLGFKSQSEWYEFARSEKKPRDIPSNPYPFYKEKGWVSWGDWLGTNSVAAFKREFLPFVEARHFVQNLKLKNLREWKEYCKSGNRPVDISANPNRTYKNSGWQGYGDWLGTGSIANFRKRYRPFMAARKFVHSLKLQSGREWKIYCKSSAKPGDIPATPRSTYAESGWKSMGDWLGTGTIAPQNMIYREFADARDFVHALKLKNSAEWLEYCKSGKKPNDIPANPKAVYRASGWQGIADWLGAAPIDRAKIQ
ncbi:DEAD/DEAH box helicase family protein [Turneriella parva]|uniref:Type III restriction protein res subunit n=1 Tax=Turneriella parva (strain ATCC BAA-1111 / DSM 21527 / NCTC 11395 / H) TaxID=869212 RepID=I4B494_TURPD|nr:DEAD/DEAH box helicase family protein [Turneriella parva]AFM12101.1 type III restriction protein res subunit [Turneriella parva DSM 21527]